MNFCIIAGGQRRILMLWGRAGLVLIAFVHSIMIEFPDLSDFRWDGLEFCVVGCRIGRSGAKCEILILLTDLWRSRRSHGAKISERIQKFIFLVFQRCGNAPFCAERPDQLKFLRFEGGDDPNRPSRFEWTAKIRKPFVLSGPSPQKSGLVEW